jgi:hypothetical protein
MKKFILGLAVLSLCAVSVQAGNVLVSNYNEDTAAVRPLSTNGGVAFASGGTVAIGSFTSADPASLISNAGSPAGWAALLADFIFFGATNTIGGDLPNLYSADKSQFLGAGNPLIGKNIYTLIGNGGTLAASGEGAIVRHADQFVQDLPTFSLTADLSLPSSTVLFGTLDGPQVVTVIGTAASLRMAPIPEPMTAALLFSALALVGRRRRA